jgi:predicted enzyme related to lactoylglutathione lyase
MTHPVVHAEIRSADPDATRQFYADLFGWKVASERAVPGY